MKNLIRNVLLLLVLQFITFNLYANTDEASPLIHQSDAGITYAYGGVGQSDREEIKALRKNFNLQLTFAKKESGEFIADVDVQIQDMKGNEVLDISNIGPLFLAELAPGQYRVKATRDDKVQTKTVRVIKRGMKDLYFYW